MAPPLPYYLNFWAEFNDEAVEGDFRRYFLESSFSPKYSAMRILTFTSTAYHWSLMGMRLLRPTRTQDDFILLFRCLLASMGCLVLVFWKSMSTTVRRRSTNFVRLLLLIRVLALFMENYLVDVKAERGLATLFLLCLVSIPLSTTWREQAIMSACTCSARAVVRMAVQSRELDESELVILLITLLTLCISVYSAKIVHIHRRTSYTLLCREFSGPRMVRRKSRDLTGSLGCSSDSLLSGLVPHSHNEEWQEVHGRKGREGRGGACGGMELVDKKQD